MRFTAHFFVGHDLRGSECKNGMEAYRANARGGDIYHTQSRAEEELGVVKGVRKKWLSYHTNFWRDVTATLEARRRALEETNYEKVDNGAEGNALADVTNIEKKVKTGESTEENRNTLTHKIDIENKASFYINPLNRNLILWDVFMGLLIVYEVTIIPYIIAYHVPPEGRAMIFDIFTVFAYVIDMLLSIFTAYNVEGTLLTSQKKMALHYLRTWFIMDALSTVPYIIFLPRVISGDQSPAVYIVQLFRLLKVSRITRIRHKFNTLGIAFMASPTITRLLKLLGIILFVAHIISCTWFFINECTSSKEATWIECGGSSTASQYLASFYWTTATLIGVGYGSDISADSNAERAFALVTETFGAIAFGFIIAMVNATVEAMDTQASARSNKTNEIRGYMAERNFSKELQRKIRRYFKDLLSESSPFIETVVMQDLPQSLRIKLAYEIHGDNIETLQIFTTMDVMTITEMVYRFKPMALSAGDILLKSDEVLEQCFFVTTGCVGGHLKDTKGTGVLVAIHQDGSDFELVSLVKARGSLLTYYAQLDSHLLWLDDDDIFNIMADCVNAEHMFLDRAMLQHTHMNRAVVSPSIEYHGKLIKEEIIVDWKPLDKSKDSEKWSSAVLLYQRQAYVRDEERVLKATAVRTVKVVGYGVTKQPKSLKFDADTYDMLRERNHSNAIITREFMEYPKDILMKRQVMIPNMRLKTIWDASLTLLVVFTTFTIPLRVGFGITTSLFWSAVDWVTDVTYVFDVLFSFRVAYLNSSSVYVTVPRMIARRYICGWFTIDALSAVPFDRITKAILHTSMPGLRLLKLLKVLKITRTWKLGYLFKRTKIHEATEEIAEKYTLVFRIILLLLTLSFFGHFFGCFWSMVSLITMDSHEDTWWGSIGIEENQVGYGDIVPVTDGGRIFATVTMVVGAIIFAYIIRSISTLARNPNLSQERQTNKLVALSSYLEEKKIGPHMQESVMAQAKYYVRNQTAFNEEKLLSLMPPSLRVAAIMEGKRETINKIPVFKNQKYSFVSYVVSKMIPVFYAAGDIVISEQEYSTDIVFIIDGKVQLSYERDKEEGKKNRTLQILGEGLFFGHNSLIRGERRNDRFEAFASTDCLTHVLPECDILRMMKMQPEVYIQLQKILNGN